jgi:hypothetical protein
LFAAVLWLLRRQLAPEIVTLEEIKWGSVVMKPPYGYR